MNALSEIGGVHTFADKAIASRVKNMFNYK